MRVLVTGGTGYLGGRLSQYLAAQKNFQITLASRRKIELPDWLPGADVVQIHPDSAGHLKEICAGADTIVHMAGMNAEDCATDPVAALEVNALETGKLVNAAAKAGTIRFIYLSTAHVYSSPLSGVISEQTCPRSLHPYATSHRAGEDMVIAADQAGGIEALVIRLSNAFGAPAHKNANCWMLMANDLCRQAATTRKMVLRSSGLQRRDFIPLTDLCRAVEHLLCLPEPELGARLLNLGGIWSPTVWEVACLIQQRCKTVLGYKPELVRLEPGPDAHSDELDYRIDRLVSTGFQLKADRVEEIDKLLKFCKSEFV